MHPHARTALAAVCCLGLALSAGCKRKRYAGRVLDNRTNWRCWFVYRSAVIGPAAGAKVARGPDWRRVAPTPGPSGAWRRVDFDDGHWQRLSGPFFPGTGNGSSEYLARLCLRGKFNVDDPSCVHQLHLAITFRGGAAAYLNGTEVARAHLPAGRLAPDTLADDYPPSAATRPDPDIRLRRLSVTLDGSALRKGLNVLAVEVHRSAFPPGPARAAKWATCGLHDLTLTADPPESVRPSFFRPQAARVWNADPLAAVGREVTYGEPSEPLRPIRLVGPRNGVCSGQVVVSDVRGVQALSARIGPFAGPGGRTLPPSAAGVRYTAPPDDALNDRPAAGARIQSVWVTVEIPRDAEPGDYAATLTLGGIGRTVDVPVELSVCRFVLPDPKDWVSWISLWNSPESVAYQYGAEPWSDRHLELLGKSLDLMGRLGNDTLYITAIRDTLHSARRSIIVFRRDAERLVPDFTFFDKYVDLYARRAAAPKALVLYVWEHHLNRGKYTGKAVSRAETLPIVVRSPDGQLAPAEAPMYGEPGSEATWRMVVEGVRARVAKLGWDRTAIWLGVASDYRPTKQTVDLFKRIAPGMKWSMFSHGRADPGPQAGALTVEPGMEIGYLEQPRARDPVRIGRGAATRPMLLGGWRRAPGHVVVAGSFRHYVTQDCPLQQYRGVVDATVFRLRHGITRMGLDFWRVPIPGARRSDVVWNYDGWRDLYRNNPRWIVAPGADGPVATVRYEMLREGAQECEARCFLERALAKNAPAGAVPKGLILRCAGLLRRRLVFRHAPGGTLWPVGPRWQDRTRDLFDLAGEAADATRTPT